MRFRLVVLTAIPEGTYQQRLRLPGALAIAFPEQRVPGLLERLDCARVLRDV